jgi:hypothetical protein
LLISSLLPPTPTPTPSSVLLSKRYGYTMIYIILRIPLDSLAFVSVFRVPSCKRWKCRVF